METSASFEARSAPLPYPTANERSYGSVRGVPGNWYPYRDRGTIRARNRKWKGSLGDEGMYPSRLLKKCSVVSF